MMDVIVERNESEANVGLRGRSDGRVKRVVAVQAGLVSKRAYAIRPCTAVSVAWAAVPQNVAICASSMQGRIAYARLASDLLAGHPPP